MLKALTIGLLTLATACATATFARDAQFKDTLVIRPSFPVEQNPQPAPEIDPASAMGALTLLAAGLAVARGRRSRGKAE